MKKKTTLLPWQMFAAVFFLTVMVVISVFWFVEKNNQRIAEQNQQYLADASVLSVNNMNELLLTGQDSVAMVSYLYGAHLDSPEFDYHQLPELLSMTMFDHLRFIDMNAIGYAEDGSQMDCADREYYQRGRKGQSGICYVPSSRFTGRSILSFYTPLLYRGEIIGVVNGVRETKNLSDTLRSHFFGVDAHTFLCQQDGNIIASSGLEAGEKWENILQQLQADEHFSPESFAGIQSAFQTGTSYSCVYKDDTGTGSLFISALDYGDLVLVQTFPPEVGQSIMDHANRDALNLQVRLFIIFAIFILLVIGYYVQQNWSLTKEKEGLGQIVDSVKRLYNRFVVFDLKDNRYRYYNKGNIPSLDLPVEGEYKDWLKAFSRRYELDAESHSMIQNMKAENLRKTLTRENWFTQYEYRVEGNRWEKLSLIKLDMEQDDTCRILAASEDVTLMKSEEEERRKIMEEAFQAAETASSAKSDFLSRMSHDIRTPMNAIIGLTAIMESHLDDRKYLTDCLAKISSSSKLLLTLINEVLDMSKIESGKLSLSGEKFNLSDFLDNLLDVTMPSANARHQTVNVHLQNLVHEDVFGDELRLQQICVNILSNAVKYTQDGGNIQLTISELHSSQPKIGKYEFIFEDNGIGMSPEFLRRLFQPFERAEDERVSKTQGTGLGMTIALNLARLMGGSISVESEEGKGSKFTLAVSLPLQDNQEVPEEGLAGLSVLVLSEDMGICDNACYILHELGMKGESVNHVTDAVALLKARRKEERKFFAVALDWKTLESDDPENHNLETVRLIHQETEPDIPIVILSSYDWSGVETEARAAGVSMFISKPLFKSKLRTVFTSLLFQSGKSGKKSESALDVMRERDYSGTRVLMVEDNELNQEIVKEILEMPGLIVDIANHGKEGLEMFQSHPPGYYAIIFMDIQMPIMNGYEATVAIRSLARPDAKTIPIIAMTANTFSDDIQAAKITGMNAHLAKPLDLEHLMDTLKTWLD